MHAQVALAITDESRIAQARRCASAMALNLGFNQNDVGRAALVATEAATNLSNHAQKGEPMIRAAGDGLEILALDRGPGMADAERACVTAIPPRGVPAPGWAPSGGYPPGSIFFPSEPRHGTALVSRIQPAQYGARPNGSRESPWK